MLYKNQPVTVMRNANIDDDGYDVGKEQLLIQFVDGARAVITRSELSPEPVLVPVMKQAAPIETETPTVGIATTPLFGKKQKKKAKHAA